MTNFEKLQAEDKMVNEAFMEMIEVNDYDNIQSIQKVASQISHEIGIEIFGEDCWN